MGIEIERKFLLKNDGWKSSIKTFRAISQGYLVNTGGKSSVRVRLDGDKANINIKSLELSITRQEYEYPIPVHDARKMLDSLCTGLVSKTRHIVLYDGHEWEIDVFDGDNAGLVVAEIELSKEDEVFSRPEWLGEEVSDDARYYNMNLVKHPYKLW